MTKSKPKQSEQIVVMYVGPSVPGVMEKGKIFNNGLTSRVEKAIEECPAIKELIVPTDKIGVALNDISKKDGFYYNFAVKVKDYINREV